MAKKYLKHSLFLLLVLCLPIIVQAKVIESDDNINLEGEHNSSKLVFGNEISSNASVDGIFISFGNQVKTEGNISYGAYAGNDITIKDNVEKDLFIAGNSITIDHEAKIARDAFIAGNIVSINTDIGRNLRIAASSVDLSDITIKGNVTIYADEITFNENTTIVGSLTYYENSIIEGLNEDNIGKINIKEANTLEFSLSDVILNAVIRLARNYITMLALLLLFVKLQKAILKQKVSIEAVGYDLLKGFGVLVLVPCLALVTIFSSLLFSLSLIAIVLYVIAIYLSTLISAYVIGNQIWKHTKRNSNIYLELLVGLVIVEALSYIPIISFFVQFGCLLFGLGRIYNIFKYAINKRWNK